MKTYPPLTEHLDIVRIAIAQYIATPFARFITQTHESMREVLAC